MEEIKTVEPVVEPNTVAPTEQQQEPKTPSKNELLRELSKEYGVNLFEPEGIQKFKEFQDSQKTEQQKLQEQIKQLAEEKEQWFKKQNEYESKLKASELGIAQDKLEDALKLAEGNPDKLTEVLKKYPMFKSTNDISIGVQEPSTSARPTDMSEAEAYMAKNPLYKHYLKK